MTQYHLNKIRDAVLRLDLPLSVDDSDGTLRMVDAKGVSLFRSLKSRVNSRLHGESPSRSRKPDNPANLRDAQAICDVMNGLQELLPHLESYAP